MHTLKETRIVYNSDENQDQIMFLGFDPPTENYSRLPHELIFSLPLIQTLGEMKVILYLLRHTWGYKEWNGESKRLSIDEFCNGRKRRGGGRMDNGTGMSENAVRDGIERAIEHGFIEITEKDDSDGARVKTYYRLKSSEMPYDDGAEVAPHPSEVAPLNSTSAPLPSQVIPRTKKETKERNSRKSVHTQNSNASELPSNDELIVQDKSSIVTDSTIAWNALPRASENAELSAWAHFQEEWRVMVDNPYAGIAKNLRKRVESCSALDTDWQYFDKAKETFRIAVLSGRIPSVPTLFVGEWEKTLATQKIRGRAADSPTGMGHLPLHEAAR